MTRALIHSSALVESPIGEGTRVWAFTHIMKGATIGKDCNIGSHCFIESGAAIGDGCTIKNGVMIWKGVTLGDGVFVGPSVTFSNDKFPRSARLAEDGPRHLRPETWLEQTLVEHGASLGAGCVLLPDIRVSAFAAVAAGAVVTKDVPANAMMVGIPARLAGWVCDCGVPLSISDGIGICSDCGLQYMLDEEKPALIRNS